MPRPAAYDRHMTSEPRPFTVTLSDAEIEDLRDRLGRTRWPGSVLEFSKVIDPLTDPTAHGGDASDACRSLR